MEDKNRRQIAIYSRKSKLTGKGESIENQIELCRRYIDSHFDQEVYGQIKIYEDEGFSGKDLDRPQFRRMMEEAQKQKISMIVCYRLDRISRNIGDFARLIEELNKQNISFISIKEQFDTSSPMGRAMMYIASVFSQLERETIAERIRDNLYELSKTGRWLGGVTPTGYASENIEKIMIDGKIKKACRLKKIPEEMEIVLQIYQKFLETASLTKTERYLLQNGYLTKQGNSFSRFTLRGILSNPVYLVADEDAYDYLIGKKVSLFSKKEEFDGKHGVMAYNRTEQRRGKAHRIRNTSEWIVSVGSHEGVISGAEWVRTQKLLERNRSKSYPRPRKNTALLTGILFCGECGSKMRPKLLQNRNSEGKQGFSYLCCLKEKGGKRLCNGKNGNGLLLDREILEEIKKLPENQALFLWELKQSKKLLSEKKEETGKKYLEQLLMEQEKELLRLAGALGKTADSSLQEDILKQMELLHRKRREQKQKLAELEKVQKQEVYFQDSAVLEKLTSFSDLIEELTADQKRFVVQSLIKKAVWDGKESHIWIGEDT